MLLHKLSPLLFITGDFSSPSFSCGGRPLLKKKLLPTNQPSGGFFSRAWSTTSKTAFMLSMSCDHSWGPPESQPPLPLGGLTWKQREKGRERCLDGPRRGKSAIEIFRKPLHKGQQMTWWDSEEAGLLRRGQKLLALVWVEVAKLCLPTAEPVIALLSYGKICLWKRLLPNGPRRRRKVMFFHAGRGSCHDFFFSLSLGCDQSWIVGVSAE